MKTIPLLLLFASVSLAQAPLAPAETSKIPGTNSRVGSIEFSADGKTLVASVEGLHGVAEIHMVDVATRKTRFVAAMPEDGYIYRSGLSPDGSTLITIAGNRLAAWDTTSGTIRFHKDAEVFAFSVDGKTLVVGNWHAKWIALCDPVTGKEQRRFETLVGVINEMVLDGGQLMSLSENGGAGQVETWDTGSGKELTKKNGLACEFWKVVKDSKGALRAWGTTRKGLELWDFAELKSIRSWAATPTAFAWAPGGERVAVAESGAVVLFDAASDTPVEFFGTRKPKDEEKNPEPEADSDKSGRRAAVIPGITALEFSLDGRFLALAHSNTVVSIWNVASKSLEARLGTSGAEESARFCHVAWSPDGHTLATSADSVGIVFWDRDAAMAAWKK